MTISVDLSSSWTVPNIAGENITKPDSMGAVRRAQLWPNANDGTVGKIGGWPYDTADTTLYTLTPDGKGGGTWGTSSDYQDAEAVTTSAGSSFAFSSNATYTLGGTMTTNIGEPSSLESLTGFVVHDFTSGTWKNETSSDLGPGGRAVYGQAAFVPNFGKAGLVALLGGDTPPTETYVYEGGHTLASMSKITVYDVESDTWYSQTATGTIPPPRAESRAVGSASSDNQTYEIFIFGGSTNETSDVADSTDEGFTDVYILSLPAFTWFKAGAPSEARRSNHFCLDLGGGQMLAIGGRNPSHNTSYDGLYWDTVDPWTYGMNIFSMSNLTWTGAWDVTIDSYTRPSIVDAVYTNSKDDSTSWTSTALKSIFNQHTASTTTSTSNSTSSSSNATTSSTSSSSNSTTSSTSSPSATSTPSSKSHTPVIIGAVVGGVLGLALLFTIGLCIFLRRRKRRQQSTNNTSTQDPNAQTIGTSAAENQKLMQNYSELPEDNTRKFELPGTSGEHELPGYTPQTHNGKERVSEPQELP